MSTKGRSLRFYRSKEHLQMKQIIQKKFDGRCYNRRRTSALQFSAYMKHVVTTPSKQNLNRMVSTLTTQPMILGCLNQPKPKLPKLRDIPTEQPIIWLRTRTKVPYAFLSETPPWLEFTNQSVHNCSRILHRLHKRPCLLCSCIRLRWRVMSSN